MNRPGASTPGFPCPECGFTIQLSMKEVLMNDSFLCHGCGLKLALNRDASREALQLLQNLNVAVENLESMQKHDL